MSESNGQLSCVLGYADPSNPDQVGSTVYINSDAPLTLEIRAVDGEVPFVATFTAGTLEPMPIPPAAPPSGSVLYLDLSALDLSDTEFSNLKLQGDNWSSANYYGRTIAFTPAQTLTADTVRLTLTGLTLTSVPSNPTVPLNVTYFGVTGVASDPGFVNFLVNVTNPPDQPGDLHDVTSATLNVYQVVNCPSGQALQNTFMLGLALTKNTSVYATADTVFTLSFVYAEDQNGYGAMMTKEQAREAGGVDVNFLQGDDSWNVTPDRSADPPFWTLKPNQPAGAGDQWAILEPGTKSSTSFQIVRLVTNFKPGPTVMTLTYVNVPGYNDGSFSITIYKDPHVEITSFTASATELPASADGSAQVTLSWTVTDDQTLYLSQLPAEPPQAAPAAAAGLELTAGTGENVKDVSSKLVTITKSTMFELAAQGIRPNNIDNTAQAYVTVYLKPVIKSFTVDPTHYDPSGSPNYTLSWDIDAPSGTNVIVTSDVAGQLNPYSTTLLHSSLTEPFTQPQVFTLTAKAEPQCSATTATTQCTLESLPYITSFSVNPQTITEGAQAKVTAQWSVQAVPGTTVTLNMFGTNSSVGTSGSRTAVTYQGGSVSLTAVGPTGSIASASKSVRAQG